MYKYYFSADAARGKSRHKIEGAIRLGQLRLHPTIMVPDYLILRARRDHFSRWVKNLPSRLRVLDIGGRIQPYRPLIESHLKQYVAVDPQFEGLLDVVAVGEFLPFSSGCFDMVLCTQVLSYVTNPKSVIDEIHRVLRPAGVLLGSAPAFFPMHHDERWRFLPEGLRLLLARFREVEIVPEGHSIAGFIRTLNVCLSLFAKSEGLKKLFTATLIPGLNVTGLLFDRFSHRNDRLTANFSFFARKQARDST